jgi:ligand-binding sensor domain-containing protein
MLLSFGDCVAQTQQVNFIKVPGANGITLGRVNSITRDPKGVMWFSDQDNRCIVRYDGTQMTRFFHDPLNPNSLGGRYPECIFADSAGIIWIGFLGMGVDRFDPATASFTHFRNQTNDTNSLANDTVTSLLVDHLGNFWIGTHEGLDLLDKATGKFRHFKSIEWDSTTLTDPVVRALYEDHEGTLWVGTGFPWIEPADRGGLSRFNRESGTFTRYLADPKNPHRLINNKVRSIFEDSRGVFWVGTGGDGLHTLDRRTGQFQRYRYDPSKPDQLSRPPLVENISDHITFITEDALGLIWIGTFANGMNRYDPVTRKITHFGGSSVQPGNLKDKSCWWAYPTRDGQLWIATQEPNLYRVDLFANTISLYETGKGRINSFYKESPHVLWLGTESGLIRKDLANGSSRRYQNDPANPNSLGANRVIYILKDRKGDDLWLATYGGGLNQFNPGTGIFKRYKHDPANPESIAGNDVYSIHEDAQSDLWLATERGLEHMDRVTGKFTHYKENPNDTTSLSSNLITYVLDASPDELWVGTYYTGLNRMNRTTGRCKLYLPSAYVTCMYKDADSVLWVGSSNGLYRYDAGADTFVLFGENNTGRRISTVACIVGDDENNLWLATSSGIFRIDPTRERVILYDTRNGVEGFSTQGEYSGTSAAYGKDGQIFFGAAVGYYAFYPKNLRITSDVPKIELSKLWLKGQLVNAGSVGSLQKPIANTDTIRLHYDQNTFTLGFTAIDYNSPGDKSIYYKLENYDLDWRPADADQKAYYFNMAPGNYVFKLKVSNSTNGATAERAFLIVISGPWWKSWWAYGLYFLTIGTIIFLFDRMQRRRLIRRERERSMLRDLEMQALRAQMNPHFIFNCLSSINNFITKSETEAASDYLTKFSRLIRLVLNNSKRTYIPLEDELRMLGLYLEMEQLRYKDTFTWCIHAEPDIDTAELFIPPLLFQPFVENAVWHGLMHKAEPGWLKISIRVEENVLIGIIEDNGVGRSFAAAVESRSARKDKSMGIQITRQRLALMNGNASLTEDDFAIEDLVDRAGNAAGTKVILRIKYKEVNDTVS